MSLAGIKRKSLIKFQNSGITFCFLFSLPCLQAQLLSALLQPLSLQGSRPSAQSGGFDRIANELNNMTHLCPWGQPLPSLHQIECHDQGVSASHVNSLIDKQDPQQQKHVNQCIGLQPSHLS